jgi:hypothetical protein
MSKNDKAKSTLAEIAIQTLQDEKWRGSTEQTVSFIRRLCAGRSELLIQYISKFRDAFEAKDSEGRGEVSVKDLLDIFRRSEVPVISIEEQVFRDYEVYDEFHSRRLLA